MSTVEVEGIIDQAADFEGMVVGKILELMKHPQADRPLFIITRPFDGASASAGNGQMVAFPYSLLVKVDDSDRASLEQDDRFFLPAYMGRTAGWAWTSPRQKSTGTR